MTKLIKADSMRLRMVSASDTHFSRAMYRSCALVFQIAVTGLVGCASTSSSVRMEPSNVAKQLGVPYCKVSVPMTESEVIAHAKTDGNPNPEGADWADLVSKIQPGDQLRLVNCYGAARSRKIGDKYYYALFRGHSVVAKFHSMIYE